MAILSNASKDEFDSPVERLLASIANLRQQPTAKGAHFYRTSLRRFQAWSDVFHPRVDPKQKQALKFLDKLRKTTGKLRDAELHLKLLQEIKGVDSGDWKRLQKALESRRKSYKNKLNVVLHDSMLNQLWWRLRVLNEQPERQWESAEEISGMAKLALNEYRAFVQRRGTLTPESLHEYRLECKRFRYTAELAGAASEVGKLIGTWKQLQDVIGEWHDYLALSERAKEVVGDCPLHSALVQLTEQRYGKAAAAVAEVERRLLEQPTTVPKKSPRRARSGRDSSRVA